MDWAERDVARKYRLASGKNFSILSFLCKIGK
jgi:hypothetical protein